jgi:hypothetical protein
LTLAKLTRLRRGGDGSNQYGSANPADAGIANRPKSAAELAREAGISVTAIESARAVVDKGTPAVIAAVQAGQVPLRVAADHVRQTPPAEQVANAAAMRASLRRPQRRAASAQPVDIGEFWRGYVRGAYSRAVGRVGTASDPIGIIVDIATQSDLPVDWVARVIALEHWSTCPAGYVFGVDHERHDECEDCMAWDRCYAAKPSP